MVKRAEIEKHEEQHDRDAAESRSIADETESATSLFLRLRYFASDTSSLIKIADGFARGEHWVGIKFKTDMHKSILL